MDNPSNLKKSGSALFAHLDEKETSVEQSKMTIAEKEVAEINECLKQVIQLPEDELEIASKETKIKRLELVFLALRVRQNDPDTKRSGAAVLFKILPMTVEFLSEEEKQAIVAFLLRTMVADFESITSVYCCLGLSNFEPHYLILRCMIKNLEKMLVHHSDNALAQKATAVMLYQLSTVPEQRHDLGIFGGIELAVSLLYLDIEEDMMTWLYNIVWSFLTGITDDLPPNCYRLIEIHGINLFLHCFNTCPDESVVFSMMIAISNVAEVEELRSRLLNDQLLSKMISLLCDTESNWELKFVSSQIFALLLLEEWEHLSFQKLAIEENLVETIASWHFDTELKIAYNSPKIFQQILNNNNPSSQLWAAWTLRYLTNKNREKYGPMLIEHGFVPLLENLLEKSKDDKFEEISRTVLDNLKEGKFEENQLQPSLKTANVQ